MKFFDQTKQANTLTTAVIGVLAATFTLNACQSVNQKAQTSENLAIQLMADQVCTKFKPGMTGREMGNQLFEEASAMGKQEEYLNAMMEFNNTDEMVQQALGHIKAQCPAVYKSMATPL